MDQNQHPLSGQSREKDPGLLIPALSLDLHSNCHQGTRAEGRAELAAGGREGPCICASSAGKRTLGWLWSQGRETESEAIRSRKGLGPIQNHGNPRPHLTLRMWSGHRTRTSPCQAHGTGGALGKFLLQRALDPPVVTP